MHFPITVIVLTVLAITNVSTLTCLECVSMGNEKACDDVGEPTECNAEGANRYTAVFARANPDIPKMQPNKSTFKCFRLIVVGEEPYFLKGCTFRDLPVCEKTNSNVDCQTCEDEECNGIYYGLDKDDDNGAGKIDATAICCLPFAVCLLAIFARIAPGF
ncbi:uncharacterized protein LOC125951706 [Anopheles darlingi]|uniref:uncharacterized protein LOC125951706 n=1 Tax=Anopheles darlingi TaxID=43151 RepID=UPI002100531A|nr:uncharacterized protein LOC125951706 [Anopheles darlingi]